MKKEKKSEKKIYLILHNIRSSHNVGSIFRTAEAVGVDKIFLTGYSPSPIDKFGKKSKEISKTALGAENLVEWEKAEISKIIKKLRSEGFFVVAIEQDKKSIHYKKARIQQKTVFVFGNEVRGLDKKILKKCDLVAEIPMKGKKESLNVSVSAGIALFGMIRI